LRNRGAGAASVGGATSRTGAIAVAAAAIALAGSAAAQTVRDLAALSIEELGEVEITSASKRAEPLAQATAAVFVITADDIRRAGVTSLPEALRLAPNLEVARVNAQTYNIQARGLNSVNASNKLLVLIDGRSLYTPFFSSVFWDQQDVDLADIERIEVISGPGGTLWGTNAMNGVINVITKAAADTEGGQLNVKGGDFVSRASARWGGKLGTVGSYRVYALGVDQSHTFLTNGQSAGDDWHGAQAGFRADIAASDHDAVTVQGDFYDNRVDAPTGRRSGGNVLARWTRRFTDGSTLDVQAYADKQHRADDAAAGGSATGDTSTFDIEAEYAFAIGRDHQVVWGVGQRIWRDRFVNTANVFTLQPESQTLNLTNLFAQDTYSISDTLKATFGVKFEYSTFSHWAVMPNVRLGWQATPRSFLWASISRAERPPSRLERDLSAPGIVNPSPEFGTEKLIAYELGWRAQPLPQTSLSVAAFYNDYSDLRTTSPSPTTILPVNFDNGWEGHTYGVEAWGTVNLLPWWRLAPGVSILHKDFHLKPGQADIAGIQTVLGHDPGHQVFLRSYMELPHDVELYVGLRQIGALPEVAVPSYFEADVRLAWRPVPDVELSVAGLNLVHSRHAEATQPPVHEIPRSVYAGIRWRF